MKEWFRKLFHFLVFTGLVIIAVFSPFTPKFLIVLYEKLKLSPPDYYDLKTPITLFEIASIALSAVTLVITSLLAMLTYKINQLQYEMLRNINDSAPKVKLYPSKISFVSHDNGNKIVNQNIKHYTTDELLKIENVLDVINSKICYTISAMLELTIYNEGKNGVGTIVSAAYLEVYRGNELLGNRVCADKIVEKNIKDGGKNYSPDREFTPIYVESQNVFQGIIQFETFNVQLEENEEYKFSVIAETPDGEFTKEFLVNFRSLRTTIEEEKRKIKAAIDFVIKDSVASINEPEPIYHIDSLLRGVAPINDDIIHRYKFSNTYDCKVKLINK